MLVNTVQENPNLGVEHGLEDGQDRGNLLSSLGHRVDDGHNVEGWDVRLAGRQGHDTLVPEDDQED